MVVVGAASQGGQPARGGVSQKGVLHDNADKLHKAACFIMLSLWGEYQYGGSAGGGGGGGGGPP